MRGPNPAPGQVWEIEDEEVVLTDILEGEAAGDGTVTVVRYVVVTPMPRRTEIREFRERAKYLHGGRSS